MPTDDRHPSLRLAQDIGAIKQGVKTLDEGQREVDRKITGIQRTIATLVTKEDCRTFRGDLTDRIKRPPSGSSKPLPADARPTLLEMAGRKAGAIAAILALLSMMLGGLVVLSRFVSSLERTMEVSRAQQAKRTDELLHQLRQPRQPIVIQQQVPARPDAGAPRRRRRTRRAQ